MAYATSWGRIFITHLCRRSSGRYKGTVPDRPGEARTTGFGIVLVGCRFDVVLSACPVVAADARFVDVAEIS
jgi:hypothetical protein